MALQTCTPGGVRTPNPQGRNLVLYPIELRAHFLAKNAGLLRAETCFSILVKALLLVFNMSVAPISKRFEMMMRVYLNSNVK